MMEPKPPYYAPWSGPTAEEFAAGVSRSLADAHGVLFADVQPFEDEWTFGEVQRVRLILAAPELLEALLPLTDLAEFILIVVSMPPFRRAAFEKAVGAARAAIAKAEGTSPGRANQSPEPTQPTEAK